MGDFEIELNENAWSEKFDSLFKTRTFSGEADVTDFFEDITYPKIKNSTLLAKIMVLPSFETRLRKCYEIYKLTRFEPHGEGFSVADIYSVLRMTWDEMRYINKVRQNPNMVFLNTSDVEIIHSFKMIDIDTAKRLFNRFDQAKIPSWSFTLANDDISGNDGTIYEVWFGDGFWRSIRYSWWEELPEQWVELDKATHATMRDIDAILDDKKDD